MATFQGDFRETFTTSATPLHARNTFGDLDTIIENYGALESGTKKDNETVTFLLTEQNHGVTKFQGNYTCRYTFPNDETLVWVCFVFLDVRQSLRPKHYWYRWASAFCFPVACL